MRRALAPVVTAALGLGGLAVVAPSAQAEPVAAPDHLVISQVNGDQSGVYGSNWVELYNPGDTAVSLGTISGSTVTPNYYLCVTSAGSSDCSAHAYKLYGTVLPHHHYLVELAYVTQTNPELPAGVVPDLNFGSTDPAVNPSGQASYNFGGYSTGAQVLLLDAAVDTTGAYPTAANDTAANDALHDAEGHVTWSWDSTHRNLADASLNPAPVVDAVGYIKAGDLTLAGAEGWTGNTAYADEHGAPVQDAAHWDTRKVDTDGSPIDTGDNAADFQADQRDPISQASSRVAVAPIDDTTISTGDSMSPIAVAGSKGLGTLSYSAHGLPAGVDIDSASGVISGTPTAASGDYPVTVTVSDQTPGTPDTATVTFTLTVTGLPVVDPIADVSVHKGEALTAITVNVRGGTTPYHFSATGLPAGVSIDADSGVISGTPTDAVGHHHVTVTVEDAAGQSVPVDFTLTELQPTSGGPADGDPLAALKINEVEATGTASRDWIELYNTGGALTGASVKVSDSAGDSYTLPAQDIAAGAYVVIDGAALDAAGVDLAASDTLYLTETDDTVLDQTSWTSYVAPTWARDTDGTGDFGQAKLATKGKANSGTATAGTDHLLVAAVWGANSDTARWTNDWIELYNPTGADIDLGTVSDGTVTPNYNLCYRGVGGTSCSTDVKLSGTVKAHHYFLIWYANAHTPADDGTYPADLTPDLDVAVATAANGQQKGSNMGGCNTGGQLLLVKSSGNGYASLTGDLSAQAAKDAGVVDAIGWMNAGTTQPSGGESGGSATLLGFNSGTTNGCVISRKIVDGIPVDTDTNRADFQTNTPASFTPHSQINDHVSLAAVDDATIWRDEAMAPIATAGKPGVAPAHYAATGLPDGVSIDPDTGVISGSPSVSDALKDYAVTVTVTDSTPTEPETATGSFTLTLTNALKIDPIADVSFHKGTAIDPIQVVRHAGTPDYTFAATGLPAGVTIDPATGLISGTPTAAAGRFSVHVTVTDSSATPVTVSADFAIVELPTSGGPAQDDPLAGLRINEVEATGTPANDWVELYNTGAAVSGAQVVLVDGAGHSYPLPAQDFSAHGFVVVDGTDLHTAGLDLAAHDTLYLTEADSTTLDQTSWTSYASASWARYPDGTGDFAAAKSATEGAANSLPAAFVTDHLIVTAVYGADGTEFNSDWVELYNPTDAPIVLGTIDDNGVVTPNYYQCYRGNASNTCSSMKLYGTVQPHHHFLIWNGHNAAATVPAHSTGQPPAGITPDLDFRYGTNDTNTAATKAANDPSGQTNNGFGGCNTGGQLWLLNASSNGVASGGDMSSAAARAAGVVDGVGWTASGTTQPTGAESAGSSTVVGLSSGTNNACVISRKSVDGHYLDADYNNTDFETIQDPGTFTLHSQASDRLAITPIHDAEISLHEAMPEIQVKATAIWGDLAYSAAGLPAGISIDPATGVISGTPDDSDELTAYPVTVTVSDGVESDTNTASFTLTVSTNLRLDPIADVSVHKGESLADIHTAAHGGTPAYTYSATGLPAGVGIDAATGVISGTATDDLGRYTVQVTVTDSAGTAASVSRTFTLVELPPLAGPTPGDPQAALKLNEVKTTGTPADDFVEIVNTGGALTNVSVTLVDGAGDTYALPTQDIAAGAYLVVEGAALATAGVELTDQDTLYLVGTDDTLLDQTTWTSSATTSWARVIDGTGDFGVSAWPTKGEANPGAPVIHPNDLFTSEVNYDANSTDWYEYTEVTNTTDHPIDFAAYGLTLTKSNAVMTFHDPSDTSESSPVVDPVIPAHGTQLFWWVENQYFGVKSTADFLANYGLAPTTGVVLVYGFSSFANSGGDHSYYFSVNQGATQISQSWVDTPCAANTLNGSSVCPATNGNYAEHYEVPTDRSNPVADVFYNSLAPGGDTVTKANKAAYSTPGTVDLAQLGFSRDLKIDSFGSDGDSTSDWVKIRNTSDASIDLSGYVITDKAGQSWTLPQGTDVAAGDVLQVSSSDSGLDFVANDAVTLLAPQGYRFTDGHGLIDTTGPYMHTLPYDASSGEAPVIDETTGLPLPPAGGLYRPAGVSARDGSVYVSNTGVNVFSELVDGSNAIVAGALSRYGFDPASQDGGDATAASLYQPGGSAVDADGNIYLADSGDNVILKITKADGKIHLVAGTGSAGAGAITATSTGTSVSLWHPDSVALDAAGNLYIADTYNNRVVKVTQSGAASLVAGTGQSGYRGDGAAATAARLAQPADVAVDSKGNLYIADASNNVIRRVDAATGVITTVAGDYAAGVSNSCLGGYSGDGGPATSARLNDPQGVAVDSAGDLFIADTFNNAVRQVTPDGTISTLVNVGGVAGAEASSPAVDSFSFPQENHLNTPYLVDIDPVTDVLYIADTHNNKVAEVLNAGRTGNASGPVESDEALAISSDPTASSACAALANGPVVSTSAPTISGTPAVGSTLTAHPGTWAPTPDSYTYQWLRDGTPIDGATGTTYVVTLADGGHALTVSVTAAKEDFASASASSAAVNVPVPSLTAGKPTITGTPTVGSTLTAHTGSWTPAPTSFTYQWLRDGASIAGATRVTYTATSADAGHRVSVRVTGAKTGYRSVSATSPTVTVTLKTLTASTPTISGTFKVGYQLIARPGTWKAGTTTLPASYIGYQWLRNGSKITGATRSTYILVAADKSTRISVTVTGKYPGYATVSKTSAAHTIAAGSLSTATPRIVGTTKVGRTVTVAVGTWKAGAVRLTGSHLKYQWYASGKRIPGATRTTYTVASKYKGKRLTVAVTGSYSGYTTVTRTSAAHTVAAGTLTVAAPKVVGTAKVGKKLTAKVGTWKAGAVRLTGSHLKYQWYASGKRIPGATRTTYTVASKYKGKRITVKVTGSYSGYTTATKTSKSTAAVKAK